MGKGNRTRNTTALKKELSKQAESVKKSKKRKTRITAAIVTAAILLTAFIAVFSTVKIKNLTESGYFARKKVAMLSENYSVDVCMMQYFFNTAAQQYASNYSDYLDSIGLDLSKDLKNQTYYYDQSKTWYDYFMETAKSQVEDMLVLCEAAKADGIKLDDTDSRYLELINDSISKNSTAAGTTKEKYLEDTYGKWVNEDVLNDCLKIAQLSAKYQLKYTSSLSYSSSEISAYFDDNKSSLLTANYIYYPVQTEKEASYIASASTKAEFKNRLESYIKKRLKEEDKTLSESDLSSDAEEALTSAEVSGATYDTSTESGKWIFSSNRKADDITYIKEDSSFGVYYILAPAKKDTEKTVNVRHILIATDDSTSENEANLTAKRILKEWKNGKKTEESFAELAKLNSSDTGSILNGGLYENVKNGDMVEEFNDWIFDSSRKSGDTDIVKTDYGYHIMYFVGPGKEAWKADTVSKMEENAYSQKLTELKEKYKVSEKSSNLEKVNQIISSNASNTESQTQSVS